MHKFIYSAGTRIEDNVFCLGGMWLKGQELDRLASGLPRHVSFGCLLREMLHPKT